MGNRGCNQVPRFLDFILEAGLIESEHPYTCLRMLWAGGQQIAGLMFCLFICLGSFRNLVVR